MDEAVKTTSSAKELQEFILAVLNEHMKYIDEGEDTNVFILHGFRKPQLQMIHLFVESFEVES